MSRNLAYIFYQRRVKQTGRRHYYLTAFLVDQHFTPPSPFWATPGTANFLFMAFVFLYTMYFLQMKGDKLSRKILYCLPLSSDDENLMLEKFSSVKRATTRKHVLSEQEAIAIYSRKGAKNAKLTCVFLCQENIVIFVSFAFSASLRDNRMINLQYRLVFRLYKNRQQLSDQV